LILRKIIQIVATSCQILRLKRTKLDFGKCPTLDPLRELKAYRKEKGGRGEEKRGAKERKRDQKGRGSEIPMLY